MSEEKYIEIFKEEAEEHIRTLERCALMMEEGKATKEVVKEGMRASHTIKGSARLLGLEEIGKVAHAVEDIFKDIESGKRNIDVEVVNLILKGVDAVKSLIAGEHIDVESLVKELRGERTEAKRIELEEERVEGERKSHRKELLRIPRERLDRIIEYMGELVIQKMRMEKKIDGYAKTGEELEREVTRYLSSFLSESQIKPLKEMILTTFYEMIEDMRKTAGELATLIQDMEVTAMVMRYVPFGSIADDLRRMVREIANEQGKSVKFDVKGSDIELDKADLDRIKPALIHLIRNAIDHGIEKPEERVRAGKVETGTIRIELDVFGEFISISVMDDGRGIDVEEVVRSALERGVITHEKLREMSQDAKLRLIFEHGVSTKREITELSGRGVGMDIVKSTVEEMRGYVEVSSKKGEFTKVTLYIPKTSFTMRGIKITDGDDEFIIPVHNILSIMGVRKGNLVRKGDETAVEWDEKLIPVKPLSLLVRGDEVVEFPDYFYVIVLKSGERVFGIKVDDFSSDEDFVIKPPSQLLVGLKLVAGVSIAEDGFPLIILNVADLADIFYEVQARYKEERLEVQAGKRRILLVEDSITTLTIERNILELAGYEVDTAMDGEEGLKKALSAEVPYDLFIVDIQMPKMDGIELTKRLRETERYKRTPIIVVSSMPELKYSKLARGAGATDFFSKGKFDKAGFIKKVEEALSTS